VVDFAKLLIRKERFFRSNQLGHWTEATKRAALRKRRYRGLWYVYLMQVVTTKGEMAHKIGISCVLTNRHSALQNASPWKIAITHRFRCKGKSMALAREQALHRMFEDKRMSGEWFALTAEDILKIEAHCATR